MPNDAHPATDAEEPADSLATLAFVQLWRRKILLLAWGGAIGLAFVGASYLLPVTYRSAARIIPANLVSEESDIPVGGSLLNLARSAGLSVGAGGTDPSALIPEILDSDDFLRGLLDQPIHISDEDSLPLIDLVIDSGEKDRVSAGLDRLSGDVLSSSYDANSGVTSLSATLENATAAADLANLLVPRIEAFYLDMRTSQARHEAVFIAQRLEEVGEALATAERKLADFRERNRAIVESPQLRLEEDRLAREVQVNQEVYMTLKTQQELAKIQELKSVPTLRVIEHASVPRYKHSPSRSTMGVAGFLLGIFGVALFVIVRSDRRTA